MIPGIVAEVPYKHIAPLPSGSWSTYSLPIGFRAIGSSINIAYGHGVYVYVDRQTRLAISPDLLVWELPTGPAEHSGYDNIAFAEDRFIVGGLAVANNPANKIIYSDDGIDWYADTNIGGIMPAIGYTTLVGYTNSMFVSVGNQPKVFASSVDGKTWVASNDITLYGNNLELVNGSSTCLLTSGTDVRGTIGFTNGFVVQTLAAGDHPFSTSLVGRRLYSSFADDCWYIYQSNGVIAKSVDTIGTRFVVDNTNPFSGKLQRPVFAAGNGVVLGICNGEVWKRAVGNDQWIKDDVAPLPTLISRLTFVNGKFIAAVDNGVATPASLYVYTFDD